MATTTMSQRWTVADSAELYNIRSWSNGYFSVNDAGNVTVEPPALPSSPSTAAVAAGAVGSASEPAENGAKVTIPGTSIDMKALVDEVRERGIGLPLLLRFPHILRALVELNEAFQRAMREYGYGGAYKGVYPIKVNQDRYVVEHLVEAGRPYHFGLEAGSKPELLAVMAMLEDPEALIICNGYKDEEYIETALMASRLGRIVILVVEKPSELDLIARLAQKTGIRPRIGIRARLSTRGSGHWEGSAGDRSKFGLGARDLFEAVEYLKKVDLLDCFELVHFHLGSQISSIRSVKNALREGGRTYVELHKLGAPLKYFDVGGGLGIDYDGSQTNFSSSMNYTLQEYANDIVFGMMELCDPEGVPHPNIVSESGRAVVAHHAVLVVDVLGVGELSEGRAPTEPPIDSPLAVRHLWDAFREVSRKNILEAYHDAVEYRDECLSLFNLGHLTLRERVWAEDIYWALCQKILRLVRELDEIPEELDGLEKALSDTYFCNFSVFQSAPDSWAIDQLVPVIPLHRHNEEPTRRAVLADITCDSDGKIDKFIDRRDVKSVLELHPVNGNDYLLGLFLVGAYQEILGDLHNLFGDTNTVLVSLDGAGGYHVDHVVAGDTVAEVLKYVCYDRDDLMARLRRATERAAQSKTLTFEQSRQLLRMYEEGLSGYTYLERE
jgi:arginine decarboxylase